MQGHWYAVEGPDGTGKSTLVKTVADQLSTRYKVQATWHPGYTQFGKLVSNILKFPGDFEISEKLSDVAIQMTMMAEFAQAISMLQDLPIDAVISDRFNPVSAMAYRGILTQDRISSMVEAVRPPKLAKLIVLTCPLAIRKSRMARKLDSFEKRGPDFQNSVDACYNEVIEYGRGSAWAGKWLRSYVDPTDVILIDASRPAEMVAAEVALVIEADIVCRRNRMLKVEPVNRVTTSILATAANPTD